MAGRKAQHDADYFPFFAKDGRTLFMLQSKFGLEGIGFFTNLLRLLCTTPRHHLDLSDPMQALYTWSRIGLNDEDKAVKIVEMMVATGKIDRQLWTEKRVIYCQDFVDSLSELYAKRKEKALTLSDIRGIYSISAPEIGISEAEMTSESNLTAFPGSTIRRVEESRVEKEEFAASSETAEAENIFENQDQERPLSDDFDPGSDFDPSAKALTIPEGLRLSTSELSELQAVFGSRAEEAMQAIAIRLPQYRYRNHWAGAKTWFAKESSPLTWLDKATGKSGPQPRAEPMSARQAEAAKPVPKAQPFDEEVRQGKAQLEHMSPRDFLGRRQTATA